MDTPRHACDIFVEGNRAFIADYSSLQIVNVFDPSQPSSISSVSNLSGIIWSVFANGDYVYVAAGNYEAWPGTLYAVDVANPTQPVEVFSMKTLGYAKGIFESGGYAYVAGGRGGFHVIEVPH